VPFQDLHAGEELVQVGGDELLDGQEARAAAVVLDGDEARHVVRHLDPGEQLGAAAGRVAQGDGQIQRTARDVGERVRGVDRERGQHREDLLAEVGAQPLALRRVQLGPADQLDALGRQLRADLLAEAGGVPGDQVGGALGDHFQLVAQRRTVAAAHRQAGLEPALEAGDPDHVELVQVAGEDGEELGPLQQRGAGVLGQRQHPGVEVEPGQLAVEEPVLRQLGQAGVGRGGVVVQGGGCHGGLRRLDGGRGGDLRTAHVGVGGLFRARQEPPVGAAAASRGGHGRVGCPGRRGHRSIIARPG
jgi:hypothetical protein